MKLIDADALHKQFYDLTKFKKDKHTGDWVSQRSVKISDALRMINDAPTVEADIVRCKDCEHRHWDKTSEFWTCYHTMDLAIDDNDYCSLAKMKGGAE